MKKVKIGPTSDACFLEAVAYHFVRDENPKKIKKFIEKKLIVNIKTPVDLKSIKKFENDNKELEMKINVLSEEDGGIFPVYFSKKMNAQNHITLLLYKTCVGSSVLSHYMYIEDVDKFLSKSGRDKHGQLQYARGRRCLNCLARFASRRFAGKSLDRHYKLCLENKPQAKTTPKKGETIKFKNHVNRFFTNYVGFLDFECKNIRVKDERGNKTEQICEQVPITYSFLILDTEKKVLYNKTYTGTDCVQHLINQLLLIEEELKPILEGNVPLVMTEENERDFLAANTCHICEESMDATDKVRDHSHITGSYLGAAHTLCNMKRTEKKYIPMYAHNMVGFPPSRLFTDFFSKIFFQAGYDSHFLIKAMGGNEKIHTLQALPYNTEKFRVIKMNNFRFLDSLSFLNASLQELMSDLVKNKNYDFSILKQLNLYKPREKKKLELLKRKGVSGGFFFCFHSRVHDSFYLQVYPYEYVTSIEKLRKCKKVPKRKHFYSKLTNTHCELKDYKHAKKVFKTFKCRDMVDYTGKKKC
jgi:hypothetical protein